MDTFYTLASSSFSNVVGYSPEMVSAWATSSVLRTFIGLPFVVLHDLKGWLIAAAIIGAILYFSFSAFRFFRH